MANSSNRFYGVVGYAPTMVDEYGVATAKIIPRTYYGDVLKTSSRWNNGEKLNDDILVTNRISILADPYAIENFPYIRFVEWMGTNWEVSSIDVEFPRIILTLGGVYNGQQT